jgi:PST family polysaccharide transporter
VKTFGKGKAMLHLGFFMSLSGIATSGSMYLVRSFIVQQDGLASVGYFVAAWSISTMYISAIFGAMSADYFPRLSGLQHDPVAVSKMVNEQSEIAVLLAAPVIVGLISFLPLAIQIFYAKNFGPTATILSWQLVGDFFKVLSWPIGFIILATGRSRLFLATELIWHLIYLGLVYFGWEYFSIEVTGIAFLIAYVFYLVLIYGVAVKSVGFKWTAIVVRYILFYLPLVIASFICFRLLSGLVTYITGAIFTVTAIIFSFFHLKKLIDINGILVKLKLKSTL